EAGRELMLGLLDRHAVEVVEFFAVRIITPSPRGAGKLEIVGLDVDDRTGGTERGGFERFGKFRHMVAPGRGPLVALSHHHPAHVFEHARSRRRPAIASRRSGRRWSRRALRSPTWCVLATTSSIRRTPSPC